jgi:ribose-phosphate pyrophosphokinase
MKLFSGSSNKALSEKVAGTLGVPVSHFEIFVFPDGERRIRILERVVDENCVIIQPTSSPVDINYMELFFIANALKRNGAKNITAVIPYMGYQRQDHLFREGEAISLEVIIKALEAVGIDHVVTVDLHSVRIEESFSISISHLSGLPLFAGVISEKNWKNADTVLVSPDRGGIRRIKQLAEQLDNMLYAVVEKNRDLETGAITALSVDGPLAKRAIIVDDMISSGATVIKVAELLREKGVEEVIVFATHGIFASGASKLLQESVIDKVFITDTVLVPETKKFEKMEVLSVVDIVAGEFPH